ncbi:MAG: FAD-dependent oxidoreductase, partial [Chloroflexota bacterium]
RVAADMLLVATGRRPHVNGMNLEAAGVKYTPRGIQVDENLRTSQEHIYAAGDVTGGMQFTHYAGFQGSIAARNALLPGSSKGTTEVLPWTTFTEPEIAHVGLTEPMAEEKLGKGNFEARIFSMEEGDRAQAEDDMDGFVKIIHQDGKLLGVTVVSKRAGETINEYAMVMQNGGGVGDLSNTIHSYPTYGQISANFASKMKVERLLNSTGFKVYTKVRDTFGL